MAGLIAAALESVSSGAVPVGWGRLLIGEIFSTGDLESFGETAFEHVASTYSAGAVRPSQNLRNEEWCAFTGCWSSISSTMAKLTILLAKELQKAAGGGTVVPVSPYISVEEITRAAPGDLVARNKLCLEIDVRRETAAPQIAVQNWFTDVWDGSMSRTLQSWGRSSFMAYTEHWNGRVCVPVDGIGTIETVIENSVTVTVGIYARKASTGLDARYSEVFGQGRSQGRTMIATNRDEITTYRCDEACFSSGRSDVTVEAASIGSLTYYNFFQARFKTIREAGFQIQSELVKKGADGWLAPELEFFKGPADLVQSSDCTLPTGLNTSCGEDVDFDKAVDCCAGTDRCEWIFGSGCTDNYFQTTRGSAGSTCTVWKVCGAAMYSNSSRLPVEYTYKLSDWSPDPVCPDGFEAIVDEEECIKGYNLLVNESTEAGSDKSTLDDTTVPVAGCYFYAGEGGEGLLRTSDEAEEPVECSDPESSTPTSAPTSAPSPASALIFNPSVAPTARPRYTLICRRGPGTRVWQKGAPLVDKTVPGFDAGPRIPEHRADVFFDRDGTSPWETLGTSSRLTISTLSSAVTWIKRIDACHFEFVAGTNTNDELELESESVPLEIIPTLYDEYRSLITSFSDSNNAKCTGRIIISGFGRAGAYAEILGHLVTSGNEDVPTTEFVSKVCNATCNFTVYSFGSPATFTGCGAVSAADSSLHKIVRFQAGIKYDNVLVLDPATAAVTGTMHCSRGYALLLVARPCEGPVDKYGSCTSRDVSYHWTQLDSKFIPHYQAGRHRYLNSPAFYNACLASASKFVKLGGPSNSKLSERVGWANVFDYVNIVEFLYHASVLFPGNIRTDIVADDMIKLIQTHLMVNIGVGLSASPANGVDSFVGIRLLASELKVEMSNIGVLETKSLDFDEHVMAMKERHTLKVDWMQIRPLSRLQYESKLSCMLTAGPDSGGPDVDFLLKSKSDHKRYAASGTVGVFEARTYSGFVTVDLAVSVSINGTGAVELARVGSIEFVLPYVALVFGTPLITDELPTIVLKTTYPRTVTATATTGIKKLQEYADLSPVLLRDAFNAIDDFMSFYETSDQMTIQVPIFDNPAGNLTSIRMAFSSHIQSLTQPAPLGERMEYADGTDGVRTISSLRVGSHPFEDSSPFVLPSRGLSLRIVLGGGSYDLSIASDGINLDNLGKRINKELESSGLSDFVGTMVCSVQCNAGDEVPECCATGDDECKCHALQFETVAEGGAVDVLGVHFTGGYVRMVPVGKNCESPAAGSEFIETAEECSVAAKMWSSDLDYKGTLNTTDDDTVIEATTTPYGCIVDSQNSVYFASDGDKSYVAKRNDLYTHSLCNGLLGMYEPLSETAPSRPAFQSLSGFLDRMQTMLPLGSWLEAEYQATAESELCETAERAAGVLDDTSGIPDLPMACPNGGISAIRFTIPPLEYQFDGPAFSLNFANFSEQLTPLKDVKGDFIHFSQTTVKYQSQIQGSGPQFGVVFGSTRSHPARLSGSICKPECVDCTKDIANFQLEKDATVTLVLDGVEYELNIIKGKFIDQVKDAIARSPYEEIEQGVRIRYEEGSDLFMLEAVGIGTNRVRKFELWKPSDDPFPMVPKDGVAEQYEVFIGGAQVVVRTDMSATAAEPSAKIGVVDVNFDAAKVIGAAVLTANLGGVSNGAELVTRSKYVTMEELYDAGVHVADEDDPDFDSDVNTVLSLGQVLDGTFEFFTDGLFAVPRPVLSPGSPLLPELSDNPDPAAESHRGVKFTLLNSKGRGIRCAAANYEECEASFEDVDYEVVAPEFPSLSNLRKVDTKDVQEAVLQGVQNLVGLSTADGKVITNGLLDNPVFKYEIPFIDVSLDEIIQNVLTLVDKLSAMADSNRTDSLSTFEIALEEALGLEDPQYPDPDCTRNCLVELETVEICDNLNRARAPLIDDPNPIQLEPTETKPCRNDIDCLGVVIGTVPNQKSAPVCALGALCGSSRSDQYCGVCVRTRPSAKSNKPIVQGYNCDASEVITQINIDLGFKYEIPRFRRGIEFDVWSLISDEEKSRFGDILEKVKSIVSLEIEGGIDFMAHVEAMAVISMQMKGGRPDISIDRENSYIALELFGEADLSLELSIGPIELGADLRFAIARDGEAIQAAREGTLTECKCADPGTCGTKTKVYELQNVATCPAGTSFIDKRFECEQAAKALGLLAFPSAPVEPSPEREKLTKSNQKYPKGCYYKRAGGKLYFNPPGPNADETDDVYDIRRRSICYNITHNPRAFCHVLDSTTTAACRDVKTTPKGMEPFDGDKTKKWSELACSMGARIEASLGRDFTPSFDVVGAIEAKATLMFGDVPIASILLAGRGQKDYFSVEDVVATFMKDTNGTNSRAPVKGKALTAAKGSTPPDKLFGGNGIVIKTRCELCDPNQLLELLLGDFYPNGRHSLKELDELLGGILPDLVMDVSSGNLLAGDPIETPLGELTMFSVGASFGLNESRSFIRYDVSDYAYPEVEVGIFAFAEPDLMLGFTFAEGFPSDQAWCMPIDELTIAGDVVIGGIPIIGYQASAFLRMSLDVEPDEIHSVEFDAGLLFTAGMTMQLKDGKVTASRKGPKLDNLYWGVKVYDAEGQAIDFSTVPEVSISGELEVVAQMAVFLPGSTPEQTERCSAGEETPDGVLAFAKLTAGLYVNCEYNVTSEELGCEVIPRLSKALNLDGVLVGEFSYNQLMGTLEKIANKPMLPDPKLTTKVDLLTLINPTSGGVDSSNGDDVSVTGVVDADADVDAGFVTPIGTIRSLKASLEVGLDTDRTKLAWDIRDPSNPFLELTVAAFAKPGLELAFELPATAGDFSNRWCVDQLAGGPNPTMVTLPGIGIDIFQYYVTASVLFSIDASAGLSGRMIELHATPELAVEAVITLENGDVSVHIDPPKLDDISDAIKVIMPHLDQAHITGKVEIFASAAVFLPMVEAVKPDPCSRDDGHGAMAKASFYASISAECEVVRQSDALDLSFDSTKAEPTASPTASPTEVAPFNRDISATFGSFEAVFSGYTTSCILKGKMGLELPNVPALDFDDSLSKFPFPLNQDDFEVGIQIDVLDVLGSYAVTPIGEITSFVVGAKVGLDLGKSMLKVDIDGPAFFRKPTLEAKMVAFFQPSLKFAFRVPPIQGSKLRREWCVPNAGLSISKAVEIAGFELFGFTSGIGAQLVVEAVSTQKLNLLIKFGRLWCV